MNRKDTVIILLDNYVYNTITELLLPLLVGICTLVLEVLIRIRYSDSIDRIANRNRAGWERKSGRIETDPTE